MAGLPPQYRKPTPKELVVVRRTLELGVPLKTLDGVIGPTDPDEKERLIARLMTHLEKSEVTYDCTCGCLSFSVRGWPDNADSHCIAQAYGRAPSTGPMAVVVFGNDAQIGGVDVAPLAPDQYDLDLPLVDSMVADSEELGQGWEPPPPGWAPRRGQR
ncbi:MAG TPA: hypothetical protein VGF28_11260 [Thermoanaerobaculia bacterium]